MPVSLTNATKALAEFVTTFGITLNPPKTLFWNEQRGILLVRASEHDLGVIDAAIQVLKTSAPQIHFQARFVEMKLDEDERRTGVPRELKKILGQRPFANSREPSENYVQEILTPEQFRELLEALKNRANVNLLAAPEVTTVSGRQAQVQLVELRTIVTGFRSNAVVGSTIDTNAVVTQLQPFGPTLDIMPYVSEDGLMIEMTVSPQVTEFLGYEESQNFVPTLPDGSRASVILPLPRFRMRKIIATARVPDGHTLLLAKFPDREIIKHGGREVVKNTSESHQKDLHLLVFLTPVILDSEGNRVHPK